MTTGHESVKGTDLLSTSMQTHKWRRNNQYYSANQGEKL